MRYHAESGVFSYLYASLKNFVQMKRALTVLLFTPFLLQAQEDKGVHFEQGLSWAAVQAKAKAENKYIFMDCFTTWCGPCKYMSAKVFPQEASGKYFNDKFISIEVQLDTSKADNDTTKAWYADAHSIAELYGGRAYPTFLVFAPDGRPVHRLVGSSGSAEEFIARVGVSFDPAKQYYTLLDQYKKGRSDSAFLHKVAMSCFEAYDRDNGKKVTDDYLATQSDLFNRDALYLIDLYTNKSTDKYFSIFIDHSADVDKVLGPKAAETKVRKVFIGEGADRQTEDKRPPDWAAVRAKIAAKLPAGADELTARVKINFYRGRQEWPDFEKAIVGYMKTYGDHMTDPELNDLAWSVFENCPDMTCVSEVLDWSKRLKDNSDPGFVDTYANILYKLGKKDEAIALETKAVDLVPDAYKSSYQETLGKMKKGEKTW
jgi:thiol-disulfide isomerase/thioredoxin